MSATHSGGEAAKHTPGPWIATEHANHCIDVGSRNECVASVGLWSYGRPGPFEENRANARLIAAAPNLLAQHEWNRRVRDSVDALLAEAGYAPDSSARHQLSQMNFDALAALEGAKP